MLTITPILRKNLLASGVVSDPLATDESARQSIAAAIRAGTLTVSRIKELAGLPSLSEGDIRSTPVLEKHLIERQLAEPNQTPFHYQSKALAAVEAGSLSPDMLAELTGRPELRKKAMTLNPTIDEIANAAGSSSGGAGNNIRVKKASERYSQKTTPVINKMTGQPLTIFGSPVESPSEASNARVGAWFKHFLRSRGDLLRALDMKVPTLNEHEKQLLEEVYHAGHWCGTMNKDTHIDRALLTEVGGLNVKAMLDDATSGGQTLVPYEFDAAIVRLPYLHSQIFPLVDLRTCGSSEVKTGKMGQVTVSWGIPEGTAASLFNTDSLVSELAIPLVPCTGTMEIGKDFDADTPVADFGAIVTDEFGQAMLSDYDRVICEGNGTTEPEGFLTASGTISVNSDNSSSGPWTYGDLVELFFSVPLQYREQSLNGVFISNDTTFMRSRQIKVDTASPSTDQRPVLNTVDEVGRYMSLGYPHKISNSGMTNRQMVFLCAKKYRFYRRTGIEVLTVDQDWTLARQNKRGIIVRSRVGGKLIDGNSCAKIADGQS